MTKAESHKVTISSVRAETIEKKRTVDAELAAIRKRLGINLPDNELLPLDADGNPDLAKIYEQIARAISEIRDLEKIDSKKTPAQVKESLDNFVRVQDRFLVAIKIAQSHYFSAVISNCDQITKHLETKDDLAEIPHLSDALRRNVQRINEVPSIAQFESRSDELARLISLQSVAAKLIELPASPQTPLASADAQDSLQFRQTVASLSHALQENIQPFTVFISNQEKPVDQHQPIPQVTENFAAARDVVIKNTIDLGNMQAAHYAKLAAEKNQELQAQQKSLSDELAKARVKFAEESKPKSGFKRFLSAITFGAYKGGKPNDTSTLQAQIKTLQQNLAQIEQQIKNTEFQTREAQEFVKDITQYRDATAKQHQETKLTDFTRGTEKFANELSLNQAVRAVAQQQAREESAHQTKQQVLEKDLRGGFRDAFVIAQAIKDGKVAMQGDGIDAILGGVQMASEHIPVVGQAIGILAKVAQQINTVRRTEDNTNTANFATEHEEDIHSTDANLRDLIVEHFTHQLSEIYGHIDSDGTSPLDALTRQGVQVFSTTVVTQAISAISSFKFPENVKVPTLDANRFRTDLSYRSEISDRYGITIDNARIMDPQYAKTIDNQMCASFVAQALVSSTIAGVEAGKMPKQLREFASKVRFKDGHIEPQYADKKFTVNGMMQRIGIVTREGQRFVSDERKEGVEGIGSKYGFRLATENEETTISRGQNLKGYISFTPAMQMFEEQKQQALQVLLPQDFKNSADFENRDEVVSSFVHQCCEAKATNAKLDIHQFLKDNSPFKIGKTTGIGGRGADKDRERFREIEKVILPLISTYEKAQIAATQQMQKQENRGIAIDHAALQSLTGEGVVPSQTSTNNIDKNTEIFAAAEKMQRTPKQIAKLAPYLDNSSSHKSATERHQLEAKTNLASKFDAFLRGVAGITPEALPNFAQKAIAKVSSSLSDTPAAPQNAAINFADYGRQLAQSFLEQSTAFGSQHDGEDAAFTALEHSLNIKTAVKNLDAATQNYESQKAALLTTITPNDLLSAKFFNSEKGAEGVLTSFAESYHAKMAQGASAAEMREFSLQAVSSFMRTENTSLVAKLVEFAAVFSETRFAEAAVKMSITEALKNAKQAEIQIHQITSDPLVKAANDALTQIKSAGMNLADLGIQSEGNKITIPHANSTAEKPMHLVIETDEAGKVKNAHLQVHCDHLSQRDEQKNSSIKDIIAHHEAHHDIAKEIIAQHNSKVEQHNESRGR